MASWIAAAIPVASAEPCDLITVPFSPKNTPPFTRRGSIRRFSRFNEVSASKDATRANGVALKAWRKKSLIRLAVPSPVFSATLPVKPSVTITSTRSEGISLPSTKPTKSKSAESAVSEINSCATFSSARPLCSSVPTLSKPTRGRAKPSPLRA